METLGFPGLDRLLSLNVSTKKGGERASQNEHRSISASCVPSSRLNVCLNTALMHSMGITSSTREGKNMKRLLQVALLGVLVLGMASMVAAQVAGGEARPVSVPPGGPQPAVRLGNFIEVGNDVWMHILATTEFHFQTVENFDFDQHVRDSIPVRAPTDTRTQTGDFDGMWDLLRFGV